MTSPSIPFAKMNGIGNSILVMDSRGSGQSLSPAPPRVIAREAFAYDQLMAIEDPRRPGAEAFVRIFNADGSRAEACGNGTRCVAWVLMRRGSATDLQIETEGGELACRRLEATVFSVDMGQPRLDWSAIPLASPVADTADVVLSLVAGLPSALSHCSVVNMGNPHAVFFVRDAATVSLPDVGPAIEHHPLFPQRVNVSIAEVRSRDHIVLRVWERSAGITLACGSAACATLVAAVRAGLTDRRARVSLPGGDLTIEWRDTDEHVIMIGGVELEHEGLLSPHIWDVAA